MSKDPIIHTLSFGNPVNLEFMTIKLIWIWEFNKAVTNKVLVVFVLGFPETQNNRSQEVIKTDLS